MTSATVATSASSVRLGRGEEDGGEVPPRKHPIGTLDELYNFLNQLRPLERRLLGGENRALADGPRSTSGNVRDSTAVSAGVVAHRARVAGFTTPEDSQDRALPVSGVRSRHRVLPETDFLLASVKAKEDPFLKDLRSNRLANWERRDPSFLSVLFRVDGSSTMPSLAGGQDQPTDIPGSSSIPPSPLLTTSRETSAATFPLCGFDEADVHMTSAPPSAESSSAVAHAPANFHGCSSPKTPSAPLMPEPKAVSPSSPKSGRKRGRGAKKTRAKSARLPSIGRERVARAATSFRKSPRVHLHLDAASVFARPIPKRMTGDRMLIPRIADLEGEDVESALRRRTRTQSALGRGRSDAGASGSSRSIPALTLFDTEELLIRSHVCETCGHRFRTRQTLINHEETHLRPLLVCPIEGCDRSMRYKHLLISHLASHVRLSEETESQEADTKRKCMFGDCRMICSGLSCIRDHVRSTHNARILSISPNASHDALECLPSSFTARGQDDPSSTKSLATRASKNKSSRRSS